MQDVAHKILEALEIFVEPGAVAELRVINYAERGNGYTKNYSGYYNNLEKMAEDAAQFGKRAPAVYFTLNTCNPALLARANNRTKAVVKRASSTTDENISHLQWLPIDIDAIRPAGISSTDEQHEASIERCRGIMKYLTKQGWPEPVAADSGNGAHLCYKIDMENVKENTELVKGCLEALDKMYSDDMAAVDTGVFNASRIWKLYGTTARKGDPTLDRPHRLSKVLYCPKLIEVVSRDLMLKLAGNTKEAKATRPTPIKTAGNNNSFDVESWIEKSSLQVKDIMQESGRTKYILEHCPYNENHMDAAIYNNDDGKITFSCFHNSCQGKTWPDVRELLEPGYELQKIERKREYQRQQEQKRLQRQTTINDFTDIEARISPDKDLADMQEQLNLQRSGKRNILHMPWMGLSYSSMALRPGTATLISGQVKSGKSYLMQNLIDHVHNQGHSWSYLPLEDSREAWLWRMLAIKEGDYRITQIDADGVAFRQSAYDKNISLLREYSKHCSQNPRVGVYDKAGNIVIPKVGYVAVLEWLKQESQNSRLIIIDPIAQIEPDNANRKSHDEQSDFIRQALGVIADKNCSLIVVSHLVKRGGTSAKEAVNIDDIQGSAQWGRLMHTTLILEACEMKTTGVKRQGGKVEQVTHNRIMTIGATRYGSGTRERHAFLQKKTEPSFEEYGVIAPKEK